MSDYDDHSDDDYSDHDDGSDHGDDCREWDGCLEGRDAWEHKAERKFRFEKNRGRVYNTWNKSGLNFHRHHCLGTRTRFSNPNPQRVVRNWYRSAAKFANGDEAIQTRSVLTSDARFWRTSLSLCNVPTTSVHADEVHDNDLYVIPHTTEPEFVRPRPRFMFRRSAADATRPNEYREGSRFLQRNVQKGQVKRARILSGSNTWLKQRVAAPAVV
jgi:hypothetical protein